MEVGDYSEMESEQSTGTDCEQELRKKCKDMWAGLYETHARLQSRQESNPPTGTTDMNVSPSHVHKLILKAKEKKLQAEITALQTAGVEVPSANEEYVEHRLKQQLDTNMSQLEDTLSVIKSQRKEATEELEREREILEQHEDIKNALLQKNSQLEHEKENIHSGSSQTRDLEQKRRAAEMQLTQLMKKLGAFIKEHFPLPSAEDLKIKGKSVPHGQSVDQNQKYMPLQQMMESLMNKLYDIPYDPYIKLQPHHWPPYTELLLRCGITQRHPQDCNLLKLVSFHI